MQTQTHVRTTPHTKADTDTHIDTPAHKHRNTQTHKYANTEKSRHTQTHSHRPRPSCSPGGPTRRRRTGSRRPGSSLPVWRARSCGYACGRPPAGPGPPWPGTPPRRTWSHTPSQTAGSGCPRAGRGRVGGGGWETHKSCLNLHYVTLFILFGTTSGESIQGIVFH